MTEWAVTQARCELLNYQEYVNYDPMVVSTIARVVGIYKFIQVLQEVLPETPCHQRLIWTNDHPIWGHIGNEPDILTLQWQRSQTSAIHDQESNFLQIFTKEIQRSTLGWWSFWRWQWTHRHSPTYLRLSHQTSFHSDWWFAYFSTLERYPSFLPWHSQGSTRRTETTREHSTFSLKTDRYIPPNVTAIPRQTPLHWKQAGKQFLQNLLEAGIIKPQCNPTTFTSLGFSNSPRFLVDYKSSGVNNQILCSHWPFTSPEVAGKSIPAAMKWFIKLDLLSEFFQIPIEV